MKKNNLAKDNFVNEDLSDNLQPSKEDYDYNDKNLIDVSGARSRYRKSILMFFVYFASNIIFYLILDNFMDDMGLLNALSVMLSMIPIYLLMGKKSLNETEEIRPSKKLSFVDILFFIGIMYFLSLVFGKLTEILMKAFNIYSVNVTEMIQISLNITLFIYVVIIGPILEEINYRGFHLNNTRQYGAYASILLSTLIFSFAHGNFMQGIGTLGIGFVLSYIAYFYSFKYAILLHIINNFIVSFFGILSLYFSPSEVENALNIFGIIILFIMIFSFISLFTKKRKENIRKNLKFTESEKIYLKTLLTDPFFYIYILVLLLLMFLPTLMGVF